MAKTQLSEFETARANKLAWELRDMMEEDFLKPVHEARHKEMNALRGQLEKMGFIVTYRAEIDPKTLKLAVVLNLYFRD